MSSVVERKFKSHFLYIVLLSVPFVVLEVLLLLKYPNTGLGRIISLPMTFLMNGMIILISSSLVYYLLKYTKFRVVGRVILGLMICLTLIVTVWLYPQDASKHISKIIVEDIKSLWSEKGI
ncbi:hypothetical protein [Paenibacillus sp. FSL H8-0079]|uniref:hypothetical protein n=1 Tax=Paenibacillus sp. FSL H8-0079 TaxID=2921375 RepID=UPI0030EF6E5D